MAEPDDPGTDDQAVIMMFHVGSGLANPRACHKHGFMTVWQVSRVRRSRRLNGGEKTGHGAVQLPDGL
jgi:hypothetical protein